jgi:hypothetical protein
MKLSEITLRLIEAELKADNRNKDLIDLAISSYDQTKIFELAKKIKALDVPEYNRFEGHTDKELRLFAFINNAPFDVNNADRQQLIDFLSQL